MDYAKSFTYMFEDPEWLRKLGIATLVTLVGLILSPILIGLIPLIIVLGYSLDVTSNVMAGQSRPLPLWEDWGHFLSRGAKLFVVFLVWVLPILIVTLPLGIISGVLNSNGGDAARTFGTLFSICSSCLGFLWGLVILLFSPAIYARVARTDRISSGFDFNWIWAFTRDNIGNVIIVILLTLVAGLIATIAAMLGVIALVIGLIVSIPFAIMWEYLVQAHLYGQVAANNKSTVAIVE